MKKELIILDKDCDVSLTCYLWDGDEEYPTIPRRPAVIVIPGGGYDMCSHHEADPAAMPFFQAGYHAFILRYSLGQNKIWPKPLKDYETAMQMIREKSEEWRIWTGQNRGYGILGRRASGCRSGDHGGESSQCSCSRISCPPAGRY